METEITHLEVPESLEPPAPPVVVVPPITNRFLFVDVAALRAKQLRRGARPRLPAEGGACESLRKPERVAMEEVTRGLVPYDLPSLTPAVSEQAS